jgi:TRAP-type C4-dicarboxylate transport system substrate-binding protein
MPLLRHCENLLTNLKPYRKLSISDNKKEEGMKKLILVTLVLLSVIGLVLGGCSTATPAPKTSAPTSAAPPAAPPTSQAAAEKPIELTFADYQPANNGATVVAVEWLKKVETASNGRLKFKTFVGGTLMAADQSFVELKKGTADISVVPSQLISSSFPLNVLSQKLMYGCKSLENDFKIYDQLQKQIPEFAAEWSSVKPLFSHDPGEQHLQSIKPVRSLADMKGLKVRTAGPWLKDAFTTLGASVITVPPTEIYISLQKAIIDADVHPMEFLMSYKTGEVEKYTTLLNIFDAPASRYCMNLDSYNKLPKDLQKLIDDMMPQAQKDMVVMLNKINSEGLDWCLKLGPHEVITLPPADLAKFYELAEAEAVKAAKDADAKGMPGTKMFDLARQLIKNQ